MTMKFIAIRDGIISILGEAEANRYRTVGYHERSSSADEVLDGNRSVQVWYSEGDFPKSAGAVLGDVMHIPKFTIVLTAAKALEVDLSVIDNAASTPAEIITATNALQNAELLANNAWDDLASIVWEILHDKRNENLGVDDDDFYIASRWVSGMRKNPPTEHGRLVAVSGVVELSCNVDEVVTGETATTLLETIDNTLDIVGDDVEQTGTRTDYPY